MGAGAATIYFADIIVGGAATGLEAGAGGEFIRWKTVCQCRPCGEI